MEIENGTCMKIDFCSFIYIFLDLKYTISRFAHFYLNTSDDRMIVDRIERAIIPLCSRVPLYVVYIIDRLR